VRHDKERTVSKKTMMYLAVFALGVWAGPKVSPYIRRVPVIGSVF
jgi:hypothetical protein